MHGLSGVTYKDLYKHLHEKQHITKEDLENFNLKRPQDNEESFLKKRHIDVIFEESFPHTHMGGIRAMSMDSYFKLIEHQELVEARVSSRSARRFSFVAIFLAVVTPLASMYLSYQQSKNPITLADAQISELRAQSFDDSNIIEAVAVLSEYQKKAIALDKELLNKIIGLRE